MIAIVRRTAPWLCAWLLLIQCLSLAAERGELVGKVVGVHDGDTLTLLVDHSQYKIRLAGIDAPELGQDFGTRAKQALSKACVGKTVRVETHGQDRYGRTLGEVFNGESINRRLVRDGMAWHYVKYSDSKELADAEKAAREAKAGLWADPAGRTALGVSSEEKAAGARGWRALAEHVEQRPPQFDVRVFQDDEARSALRVDDGKACGVCGG